MRIQVDFALCEGNGQCTYDAPEVFQLDDEDNLIILNYEPSEDQREKVETAVRGCPKRALSIMCEH
jgi:ferredoxin